MSPILPLQKKYRELGRLRTGARNEKGWPTKLGHWRATSASRELLEAIAEQYGGDVQVWEDAPTEGTQYEVFTTSDTLTIAIPPGEVLNQWLEQWSGGGCAKRCDGVRQLLVDRPCSCPIEDREQMRELAPKGEACQPATRLSVVLPNIPDIGIWRLEVHGWNAAEEMLTVFNLIRANTTEDQVVLARLRIDQRTAKRNGKTQHFTVPVLEFDERPLDIAAGQFALPTTERKALPATPPPTHGEDAGATGGVEESSFPGNPPEPTNGNGLPQWLQDMPGDDPDILDAALSIWTERGGDPEGLTGLAQLADMDAATQELLRARILERRQQPVPEPEAVAAAWDPPVEPEQERLV